jgi:two-component system, cell cycle response regulator DivK
MNKKILIAEDYDDARNLMCFMLRHGGYQIFEATNGKEAVEVARLEHPDLILMDISMPIMDGFTATQLIRESGDGISSIPIIAVSALNFMYLEEALKAGCNEVVSKPVDFDRLDSVMKKYLINH